MSDQKKVIIIGAGPVGLTIAIELYRYGIPFRIIDKNEGPVTTSNALGIHVRTLEIWDMMGIADSAINAGKKIIAANMFANNQRIAHIEFKDLVTKYPFLLSLPQSETEKILTDYLEKNNVFIERKTELVSFEQNSSEIQVTLSKNGQIEKATFSWLVACDGSHSAVRDKLKLNFIGEDLKQHFIMSDIQIETKLDPNELYTFFAEDGPVAIFPFLHNRCRLICEVTNDPKLHDTKSPQLEDFIAIVKKRCPSDIKLSNPAWISAFWICSRMLEQYHHNRIFFAGDAAHVHSPVSGQGMNTGIQDAFNLAWKLAYVINNKAKPELLNSYQLERHEIAKHVLVQTKAATKMVTLKNKFLQKLRNFALKRLLKKPQNRLKMVLQMSELQVNYRNGPLSVNDGEFHSGPKAGERAPYVDGLFEKLTGTKFHLLLFSSDTFYENLNGIKQHITKNYNDTIEVHQINKEDFNGLAHLNYGANQSCLYLIRPDNYITYRSIPADLSKLQIYLQNLL